MKVLVKGNEIIAYAPSIEFGVYDDDIEKWKLSDEEGNLLFYALDNGYIVTDNVDIPSDYVDGKYFYESGEFVLNEDWTPPPLSPEERIAELEAQNEMLLTCVLEMSEIVYA